METVDRAITLACRTALLLIVAAGCIVGCSDGYERFSGASVKMHAGRKIELGSHGKTSGSFSISLIEVDGYPIEVTQDDPGTSSSFFINSRKYGPLKVKIEGEGAGALPTLQVTKEQQVRILADLRSAPKEVPNQPPPPAAQTGATLLPGPRAAPMNADAYRIPDCRAPGGGKRHLPLTSVVGGQANVRGSLTPAAVERVIRHHLDDIECCYGTELTNQPDLSGRVTIQFTIAASGAILASVVQSSTINNPHTEICIAQVLRRWAFPKPQGGGIVIVSYPFDLAPAQAKR